MKMLNGNKQQRALSSFQVKRRFIMHVCNPELKIFERLKGLGVSISIQRVFTYVGLSLLNKIISMNQSKYKFK